MISDSDFGTGVDFTGAPCVCAGDSAWGLSGKPVVAHTSSTDAGTGSESGYWEIVGSYLVMSADVGRGQEGDTESAISVDNAAGQDLGFLSGAFPADRDTGQGFEPGMPLVYLAVCFISDSDRAYTYERWSTNVTWADFDLGSGSESAEISSPTYSDYGSGAEGQAYVIEIFPYPPAWLFATPSGSYMLVWRPGTPEERHLATFGALNRAEMAGVAKTIDRLRYADTLGVISDTDSGAGSEANSPTATIEQLATAPTVTCANASEATLVLLSCGSPS